MSQVLDKKLYSAIGSLNNKQKKAVLDIVKAFSEEEENTDKNGHWQDESFVAEMDARYNYYKNGGKMVTAEEANKQIKQLLQKAKTK